MKKILSVFLVLAMMLSLVVVTTVAPSAEPVTSGTKLTGENLMSLTAGEYYMDEDIDFADYDLSELSAMTLPGGTVIHGNGHSIKGLNSTTFAPFTVNGTVTINDLQIGGTDGAKVYGGLFDFGDGATLNLNNVDINIKSTNVVASNKSIPNAAVGAITGNVPAGVTVNVIGCTVTGTVGNNLEWNAGATLNGTGGFFGLVSGTVTVDNCTMAATIKNGDQNCGGFIGELEPTGEANIKNSVSDAAATITGGKRNGGFVGYVEDGDAGRGTLTIENCINRSNIEANNQWNGGFVGINRGIVNITNSMNFGNVTVTGGETETGVAGFVGQWNTGSNTMCYLKNCVNYGKISTVQKDAAALIGWMAWASNVTVSNCVNYGDIYAKGNDAGMVFGRNVGNASSKTIIEKCVNYGNLESEANAAMFGEFAPTGKTEGMYVATNCLNVGNIKGGSNTAGCLAYDGYKVSLTACSTIGTLDSNAWQSGGIMCARQKDSELINCYNYGTMTIASTVSNCGTIFANSSGTLASTSAGNKYLYDPTGVESFHTNGGTKAASVDEAVADLNALYNDTLGLSFKNVDGAIEVVTQPKLVGTQTNATGAKVRLLGTIGGDLADYAKVGFKVDSKYDVTVKTYAPSEATYAYYHIQAAGKMETAASYGGSYFYTLTFTGVPQTGTVEFTVQAYAEYTNGLTYEGARYTVTVVDGLVTSTTLAD